MVFRPDFAVLAKVWQGSGSHLAAVCWEAVLLVFPMVFHGFAPRLCRPGKRQEAVWQGSGLRSASAYVSRAWRGGIIRSAPGDDGTGSRLCVLHKFNFFFLAPARLRHLIAAGAGAPRLMGVRLHATRSRFQAPGEAV